MEPLLNIAIGAARQAGDIILRYRDQADRLKINTKEGQDFCTEVDIKAEQIIIQAIHKAYPNHAILAEESGLQGESEMVWIIDPLDGTANYIRGFPFFCVSIALQIKGRIEQAVIYDPLRHECFAASRGAGARLNDRRIRVSQKTLLSGSVIGSGVPCHHKAIAKKYLPTFEILAEHCAGMRRTGSAALDLAYVACGRLDGLWNMGLQAWDLAAGSLLIREAGGMVSDSQGGEHYLNQGAIIAGAPKVFKALLQTLVPVLKSVESSL